MPDDVDRIMRDAPARFPAPSEETTAAVGQRLLRSRRRRRAASVSTLAVVAAVVVGIAVGHWALPPDEPAIGAATAPAVTIDVQPKVVRPGASVGLLGAIVVQQQGEELLLEHRACGGSWRYLAAVQTDEHGGWTHFVIPSSHTSYRAVWRGAQSAAVSVAVRPFVLLRFGSEPKRLKVLIPSLGPSLAGHTVAFQRLVDYRWRTFRTVALHEDETAYGRTFVAEFRHSLPRGTRVRAALLLAQARPCYIGGFSSAIGL